MKFVRAVAGAIAVGFVLCLAFLGSCASGIPTAPEVPAIPDSLLIRDDWTAMPSVEVWT